jgi:hypothetical protein
MTPSIESMYTAGCWPSSTERKAVSLSAWPTSLKGESEGTLKCWKNSASADAGKLLLLQLEHEVGGTNLKASRCGLSMAITRGCFHPKSRPDAHRSVTLMHFGTQEVLRTTSSTKAGICTALRRKRCLAGLWNQGRSSTTRTAISGITITLIWK